MLNPLKALENNFYKFRDILWEYPNVADEESDLRQRFVHLYSGFSPYSHFVLAVIATFLLLVILYLLSAGVIRGASETSMVEAVVVGQTEEGDIRTISSINPLIPSNVQLEKDLSELIYEPLYRYDFVQGEGGTFDGGVENILLSDIVRLQQGADYEFSLKRGVFWHDGKEFSAEDVIRTFEIIAGFEDGNASTLALNQFFWEKIDDYTVRVCTKPIDNKEILSCDDAYEKPILANFLELLSFKIIPAHLSADIDPTRINQQTPILFRSPVGTGRYKFKSISDSEIKLERNDLYHNPEKISEIENMVFKFFKSSDAALTAIENGEVHAFASNSTENLEDLKQFQNIDSQISPVLENQFWGLYFNLKKSPDGSLVAPDFFGDVRVRQAMSSLISRDKIVDDALDGVAQEALGPIPRNSYFFNGSAPWVTTGSKDAEKLLKEAGWVKRTGDQWLTNKDGEEMRFSLYFVNSYNREKVAESIKEDLKEAGIDVIIDRREQAGQDVSKEASKFWTLEELNNQILAPRQFDVILYGMNTFIDPDRYELYHSSQSTHPGLNIASYRSSEETVKKRENSNAGGSLERVPKVDRWLELARGFDPVRDKEERKERYDEVQSIIAKEVPLVYLYHPQFVYYVNRDIQNVNLNGVRSIEDRFKNIDMFKI